MCIHLPVWEIQTQRERLNQLLSVREGQMLQRSSALTGSAVAKRQRTVRINALEFISHINSDRLIDLPSFRDYPAKTGAQGPEGKSPSYAEILLGNLPPGNTEGEGWGGGSTKHRRRWFIFVGNPHRGVFCDER